MQVVQVAIGKFHHFHLARYLFRNNELKAIYCGYPWVKLKEESIPRDKIRSFPWLHGPYMALGRIPGFNVGTSVRRQWEWWSQTTLSKYAARTLPECDAVVALSGSGLDVGRVQKERSGVWVCDRGSAHIRTQDAILRSEHDFWQIQWNGIDPRIIAREEAEYEECDFITVPSEFNVQSFVDHGIPREKIRKISYGANIQRFKPQGNRDSNKFIILFVGALSLQKGIPYLLDAFSRFEHPKKELWIVGMPTEGIEKIFAKFRSDKIRRLGMVPNHQLAEVYSQAHAFVLPSIQEGLAMVQGESLACGCPVIATQNTGAADLFTDGKEGFIVPIRDPGAIAERLTQLADSPQLWKSMSLAAIDRVQALGGWDEYGSKYRSFLAEAISRGSN